MLQGIRTSGRRGVHGGVSLKMVNESGMDGRGSEGENLRGQVSLDRKMA
jgi:hypothetical protein